MFSTRFKPVKVRNGASGAGSPPIEILEGRRLLSASAHAALSGGHGGHGRSQVSTIEFSQAPAAVQTGLNSLAATDGVTAPTSTQNVFLSNVNGVERYTVDIAGTGTTTALTVNQAGTPVTAPTNSSTTFGALGTADAAAATEITAIATGLSLTAPTSTTAVKVLTSSGGSAVYTVRLAGSTSGSRGATISVDTAGNPVGNQTLPFSVIPTALQNALNTNAPAGATALTSTSTQSVHVRTLNGVTTYSTTFTVTGTTTTVTVNEADALATLPTTTSTTFSAIPALAATELQALATADGFSGTIAATQTVSAYAEGNGTVIYTVTLPASQTDSSGNAITLNITLSVDQAGNPTTLPTNAGFGDGGGDCDGDGSSSGTSSASNDFISGGFTYSFGRSHR